jgi:hypothetical protein
MDDNSGNKLVYLVFRLSPERFLTETIHDVFLIWQFTV